MVGIVSTGYHTDSVIVSALLSRMNITIPLMCTSLMSNTATGHGIFYMSSSSSVIVDTFLHLLKQFNWTRIGVVSDHSDSYFSQTTNLLLKKAKTRNITISSYYELERFDHNNYDYIVKHTELLNSKIIFLSVNCHKAGLIFHAAYVDNLTWPEYAWIVHSVEGYKLKQRFSPQLLEGILFINQDFATKGNLSALGSAGSMDIVLPNSIQANNLLFDAVHAILKADVCNEKITHIEINGTTGTILFTNNHVKRNVRITQMKDGVEILQATFDTNSNRLNLAESFSRGVLPNDEIPLRRSPQIPVGLAAAEITFGIVFNTIVLVLYSFYRNEKEIKATSVSLSMLIFIGCYLILLFLMLLTIESNLKHDNIIKNSNILCITLIWLSGIGLPVPLIFTTLLVKILRIYHIFNTFGKASKFSSDSILVLFVLLLLSPNILILASFSFIKNSYSLQTKRYIKIGYIETAQGCVGEVSVWVVLMVLYSLILMLMVAIVAIKTRKLRKREFRDTKKVNALIFVMILLMSLTVSYTLFFNYSNDSRPEGDYRWQSDLVLHIGHMLTLLSCHVFLFIPKLLPSLKKTCRMN